MAPVVASCPPRAPLALDSVSRKIEYTCDEEIESALFEAVTASFSMQESEAASVALSNLGHRRPSAETRRRVEAILDRMKNENRLGVANDKVTPPDRPGRG